MGDRGGLRNHTKVNILNTIAKGIVGNHVKQLAVESPQRGVACAKRRNLSPAAAG